MPIIGLLAGVVLSLGVPATALAETGHKALILTSSVSGGASSPEAAAATAKGFTVDLVSDATWTAMSAVDFADYQLVVVGDPQCGALNSAVSANATALADAVMARAGGNTIVGNRMLLGTDPSFHFASGGDKLIATGIDFTGSRDGATNLYLDFSCLDEDYDSNGVGDGVDRLLPKLTADPSPHWTENSSPPCGGSASLISNAAEFASLTSGNLQEWYCSAHMTFPTFPTDWAALALLTDSSTNPICGTDVDTGEPACGESHILIAGSGIVATAPNLALTPAAATNPVNSSDSVTATVKNNDGSARGGELVDFLVTGANGGVGGVCAPVDCKSAANGKVTFTYTGTNAGEDTVNAAITLNGSRQTATAAKTWTSVGTGEPVTVSVSDAAPVTEGNAGTTPSTFTILLDKASNVPVTVTYVTTDATAIAPGDYTAIPGGSVTFTAGQQAKVVPVAVVGDLLDEYDESLSVRLTDATGATIGDDIGLGTIVDDDAPPVVNVGNGRVVEGDTATRSVEIPVTLSAPSGKTVTAAITTTSGTATPGGDYVAGSSPVSFAPGATSATVAGVAVGDVLSESDETTGLVADSLGNATKGSDGMLTILDDERDGLFRCAAVPARFNASPVPEYPFGTGAPLTASCSPRSGGNDTVLVRREIAIDPSNKTVVRINARTGTYSTAQAPNDVNFTDPSIGDGSEGRARVAEVDVQVGTLRFKVEGLEAYASARCKLVGSQPPVLDGNIGTLARLRINDTMVPLPPVGTEIPLGPLRVIIGEQSIDGNVITQRAVTIIGPTGEIAVLGEAKAGFADRPCRDKQPTP